MTDLTSLGIKVTSDGVKQSADDLDKLAASADKAGTAVDETLNPALDTLGKTAKDTAQKTGGSDGVAPTLDKVTKSSKGAADGLNRVKDALSNYSRASSAGPGKSAAADLDALLGKIDPTIKKLSDLDKVEQQLNAHRKSGAIGADDFATYSAQIDKARAAVGGADEAVHKFSINTGAARREVGVLAGELARGNFARFQGSMITLANQTGLLGLAFSGIGAAVLGGAAALGVFLTAAISGARESSALNTALIATGGAAQGARANIEAVGASVGKLTGSYGDARESLQAITASGVNFSEGLQQQAVAVENISKVTGQSIDEVVASFVKLQKDPAAAVLDLNDKYHILNETTYAQIAALQEQGRTQEAAGVADKAYSDAFAARAQEVKDNLGLIERGWIAVKEKASQGWDAIKDVGRQDTLDSMLADNSRALAAAKIGQVNFTTGDSGQADTEKVKQLLAERKRLQDQAVDDAFTYQATQQKNAIDQQAIADRKALSDGVDAHDKATQKKLALDKAYAQAAGALKGIYGNSDDANAQRDQINSLLKTRVADINKQFADKGNGAGKIDNAENTAALAELRSTLGAINDEYTNQQKILDTQRKGDLISQADYYKQSHDNLFKAEDEQITEIQAEISRLQSRTVAGVQAVQNQKQIAELQAQAHKIENDALAKDTELTEAQTAAQKKATDGINAYIAALGAQTAARQQQIDLQVQGVGMGDKEYAQLQTLTKIRQDSADQQVKLAKQQASGAIDPETYQKEVDALNAATNDRVQAEVDGYAKMDAAQSDWVNGAKMAWANFQDQAANVAGATNNLLSSAFDNATNALVSFVTTGKASFKEFTTSLLSDIAKIALKIAEEKAVAAIIGGLFGGGASTGTDYSGALGSSGNTGYLSSNYNTGSNSAGALFANGAAFAGSPSLSAYSGTVVNKPTHFMFANGGALRSGTMGEAGDEGILPLKRTASGKLGVQSSGGGGVTNNVSTSINLDGQGNSKSDSSASDSTSKQLASLVNAQIISVLTQQSKPGGLLWKQRNGVTP